jgi:uncharacterized delta-60 repeat protein
MPDANKIIIAGGFTSFNGYLRNSIARLLPDGSLDTSFAPGSGANAPIWGMALQSDGRIVIAGEFTKFNDKPRAHIARLNADGSLDMTFNPLCASDGIIWNVSVFEGTPGYPLIYIGGDFSIVNGEQRKSIARLNPDGTLITHLTRDRFGRTGLCYCGATKWRCNSWRFIHEIDQSREII